MNPLHLEIADIECGYREPANENDRRLLSLLQGVKHIGPVEWLRMYDWVLEFGRFFSPVSLPDHFKPGKRKACFFNAQTQVLISDRLVYVEGFATRGRVNQHAWVIDSSGTLIDTTWQQNHRNAPVGTAYFGVPLTTDSVRHSIQSGFYREVLTPMAFVKSEDASGGC